MSSVVDAVKRVKVIPFGVGGPETAARYKPAETGNLGWVTAYRWYHVEPYVEGKTRDVDYYRHPDFDGQTVCPHCEHILHVHGFIDVPPDYGLGFVVPDHGYVVCPGDWIVKDWLGVSRAMKPDVFKMIYGSEKP